MLARGEPLALTLTLTLTLTVTLTVTVTVTLTLTLTLTLILTRYRKQRDYTSGDRLKEQLFAMGVRLDDREKTWSASG